MLFQRMQFFFQIQKYQYEYFIFDNLAHKTCGNLHME